MKHVGDQASHELFHSKAEYEIGSPRRKKKTGNFVFFLWGLVFEDLSSDGVHMVRSPALMHPMPKVPTLQVAGSNAIVTGKRAALEPSPARFQRSKASVPTPQSLANVQRWNLHPPGSNAAGRRFQRHSLWQTCNVGTLTRQVPTRQGVGSNATVSGKRVTLEPSPARFQRGRASVPTPQSLANV